MDAIHDNYIAWSSLNMGRGSITWLSFLAFLNAHNYILRAQQLTTQDEVRGCSNIHHTRHSIQVIGQAQSYAGSIFVNMLFIIILSFLQTKIPLSCRHIFKSYLSYKRYNSQVSDVYRYMLEQIVMTQTNVYRRWQTWYKSTFEGVFMYEGMHAPV